MIPVSPDFKKMGKIECKWKNLGEIERKKPIILLVDDDELNLSLSVILSHEIDANNFIWMLLGFFLLLSLYSVIMVLFLNKKWNFCIILKVIIN